MEFDAGQPDSDQSGEDFPARQTGLPDVKLIKDVVKGRSVTGRDVSNQCLRKCAGFVSGFTGMYISSYGDESPDVQEICSLLCYF